MDLLLRVLFILLAVVFAASGVAALAGARPITDLLGKLGVGARLTLVIALFEIAAVVGLLIGLSFRPLGIAAAGGLTALMVGAVGYHVRAGDKAGSAPAAVLALLAAAATGIGLLSMA